MVQLSSVCLILLILVGIISNKAEGFWRRRRCGAVHCAWGQWSPWSGCSHLCGNAGVMTRNRGIARHPSCGGAGCSGPSSEAAACNRFCHNWGTPLPGTGICICPEEYWGTCCPSREYSTDIQFLYQSTGRLPATGRY